MLAGTHPQFASSISTALMFWKFIKKEKKTLLWHWYCSEMVIYVYVYRHSQSCINHSAQVLAVFQLFVAAISFWKLSPKFWHCWEAESSNFSQRQNLERNTWHFIPDWCNGLCLVHYNFHVVNILIVALKVKMLTAFLDTDGAEEEREKLDR